MSMLLWVNVHQIQQYLAQNLRLDYHPEVCHKNLLIVLNVYNAIPTSWSFSAHCYSFTITSSHCWSSSITRTWDYYPFVIAIFMPPSTARSKSAPVIRASHLAPIEPRRNDISIPRNRVREAELCEKALLKHFVLKCELEKQNTT